MKFPIKKIIYLKIAHLYCDKEKKKSSIELNNLKVNSKNITSDDKSKSIRESN